MNIQINKAHFPVTVLGPGRRIGIWLQGCSIRCPGCVSLDTWDADAGRGISVDALIHWCREVTGGVLDGVTISGGEPFDQAEALGFLLDGLIDWRSRLNRPFDILCYSGLPYKRLLAMHGALLRKLDAIIPEPYVHARPEGGTWRGSDNQALIELSPIGHERYATYVDKRARRDKRFQVQVGHDGIWFIGIPSRGDMEALEARCADRGIALRRASWRP